MIPYLLMLAVPGLFALAGVRRSGAAWFIVAILYWLMIGFRFQVGMDWNNYLLHYQLASGRPLLELLFRTEPGFQFLLWTAHNLGGGYPLINAVAALVFCWGFFAVARACREPFLAVVAATPLLVVAFAMTGTRQSMAIGIIFYLYSIWEGRSWLGRILLVLLASLFHFSSIFILLFVALARRSLPVKIAGTVVSAALLVLVIYFFPGIIQNYSELYVIAGERRLDAPGAIAHVGVVAAAALAYFIYRKAWLRMYGTHPLYENLAIVALLALPAILVSSVGAYRFALYFWPMAMRVVSGMPALIPNAVGRTLYRLLAIIASGGLLVAWLTLSYNGFAWVPYENWLLQPEHVSLRRR